MRDDYRCVTIVARIVPSPAPRYVSLIAKTMTRVTITPIAKPKATSPRRVVRAPLRVSTGSFGIRLQFRYAIRRRSVTHALLGDPREVLRAQITGGQRPNVGDEHPDLFSQRPKSPIESSGNSKRPPSGASAIRDTRESAEPRVRGVELLDPPEYPLLHATTEGLTGLDPPAGPDGVEREREHAGTSGRPRFERSVRKRSGRVCQYLV
jgi:hypothetical protein